MALSETGERRRDSVLSGETAVDANPITTPSVKNEKKHGANATYTEKQSALSEKDSITAKAMESKNKDPEAVMRAREQEKASLSESSIKVKQLHWLEAAMLMFTEYIVIAILSFPSSYSVLGMAGGVIATILIGLCVLYTSHVLWRYCMAHPGATDIVDLGRRVFPERYQTAAWYCISAAFLLNNIFIIGLHVLAGSVALNTLSDHSQCTVVFAVVMTIIMFVLSLVRELNQVAILGGISAATMFIAFLLCLVFLGVEGYPAGYDASVGITVRTWAKENTEFYQGFNAVLNIVYTFVGQVLIPSYVDDMKNPEDFPKALYLCTFLEIIIFTLGGAIGYHYIGDANMTSPAYGALTEPYTKIVAAFTLPTLIVVGVLYSSVTCRFIFLRIFSVDSVHRLEHTVKGWSVWIGLVSVVYIIAFIIGEAIPFFNELLELMSTLFDWWFGFVFEALAFFAIYKKGARWSSPMRSGETILNIVIFLCGIFILGAGAYTSVQAIMDAYDNGTVSSPFSCADNGF